MIDVVEVLRKKIAGLDNTLKDLSRKHDDISREQWKVIQARRIATFEAAELLDEAIKFREAYLIANAD